jgi:putative ABC transport system substrate-binding protein
MALLLVAAPLAVEAQPAGKMSRVGIMGERASDPSEARMWEAFRLELGNRGWIEGKNLLIESRWADGNAAIAAEMVRLKVDVIVTRGSYVTQGAKTATSTIPIVFTMHADPVRTGHVANLARPGGNITGLTIQMPELNVKGLQILLSALPKAKRIAVLLNPDTPSHPPSLKSLEEAARPLQLQLQPVVARSEADLESAFSSMARAHAQAVLVLGFGPYMAARQQLAELAIKHRLPTFFSWKDHVEAGGLMSYAPDNVDLVRRGAIYVDKILRGAKPADLPVEQAQKFELVINVKTAKAIGLAIPQSVLMRADQLID